MNQKLGYWVAFIFSILGSFARAELSAFEQALQTGQSLSTHESIIEIHGRKFRKIEFQNKSYYLQIIQGTESTTDLVILCGESQVQFNRESPPLVTAAVRVTKRSRLFIEGLKNVCIGDPHHPRIEIAPELQIGFMLDDSVDSKAVLRNRRITINPFTSMLGFSAAW
jgi:hypothetical protein